jgi:hypothetical protein
MYPSAALRNAGSIHLSTGVENMTTKTLQGLLRELNIRIIPTSEHHKRTARQTCARATLSRIFEQRGYDHLRTVLQTFTETPNKHALLGPVIWAVSDLLKAYPRLFGDLWFQLFDDIDLAGLFVVAAANRRVAMPRQMIASMIFAKVQQQFPDQIRPLKTERRRLVIEDAEPELAEAA